MAKNRLTDLNDHLFAAVERLSDEDLKGDGLKEEIERAKAISSVALNIINNGKLLLDAQLAVKERYLEQGTLPKMLEAGPGEKPKK